MDNLDLVLGAVALAFCKGTAKANSYSGNEQDYIDSQIESKTGMYVPDFASVEACKPIWLMHAQEAIEKCAKSLEALREEINYLPIEEMSVLFPYSTTKKCFVKPKRLGLFPLQIEATSQLWELRLISGRILTTTGLGLMDRDPVISGQVNVMKKKLSTFRSQYWVVNLDRYRQWGKKYLKSIYAEGDYEWRVENFNSSPAVFVDSAANEIIKRSPEEIIYFDAAVEKIVKVTERILELFLDWHILKCGGMPSYKFLNQHGMLSKQQYKAAERYVK